MGTGLIGFAIGAIGMGLYVYLRDNQQWGKSNEVTEQDSATKLTETVNQQENTKDNVEKPKEATPWQTRQLLTDVLLQLNCQPQVGDEEEGNRIYFTYQNGHFFANVSDNSPFIDIWYNWWYDAPLDDIDALSNIRKAINRLNIYGNVTAMYSLDTEHNKIGVHSKKHMLFIRQIPNLPSYLSANLGDIFSDCRGFMQILQQEEKENVASE